VLLEVSAAAVTQDHGRCTNLQPKHQVDALDAAITLAWTDEPGDVDHGDKRTPHLPHMGTVTG
jgi:hypothetical protein